MACDGTESFYMGDGHNYYRNSAEANQDCDFPLRESYQLGKDPVSVSIIDMIMLRLRMVATLVMYCVPSGRTE